MSMHAWRKGRVRTQRADGICKPRKDPSGEANAAHPWGLDLQCLEQSEINFRHLKHPVCGIF